MASMRLKPLHAGPFFAALLLLGACTDESQLPDVYLLTGECQLEVSTPHDHAEILVDGILVGRNRVKTKIPCGQKRVQVHKRGYKPFDQAFVADATKTLLVPVRLEPLKKAEVYALSGQLLEDIRAGKVAKGAVEGGASAAAATGDAGGGADAAADAAINWDDWS